MGLRNTCGIGAVAAVLEAEAPTASASHRADVLQLQLALVACSGTPPTTASAWSFHPLLLPSARLMPLGISDDQ